jgi:hypothetical protein
VIPSLVVSVDLRGILLGGTIVLAVVLIIITRQLILGRVWGKI